MYLPARLSVIWVPQEWEKWGDVGGRDWERGGEGIFRSRRWSEGPHQHQTLGCKERKPQALALRRPQFGWKRRQRDPLCWLSKEDRDTNFIYSLFTVRLREVRQFTQTHTAEKCKWNSNPEQYDSRIHAFSITPGSQVCGKRRPDYSGLIWLALLMELLGWGWRCRSLLVSGLQQGTWKNLSWHSVDTVVTCGRNGLMAGRIPN